MRLDDLTFVHDYLDTRPMPDAPSDAASRMSEARAAIAHLGRLDEFGSLLARNLSGERGRAKLSQARVGERMRQLGFSSWRRQTMSMVENGGRNVAADEIVGLALVLETTVPRLTSAPDERGGQFVALPSGLIIPGRRLTYDDRSVLWDGDVPVAAPLPSPEDAAAMERHARRIQVLQDAGGDVISVDERP